MPSRCNRRLAADVVMNALRYLPVGFFTAAAARRRLWGALAKPVDTAATRPFPERGEGRGGRGACVGVPRTTRDGAGRLTAGCGLLPDSPGPRAALTLPAAVGPAGVPRPVDGSGRRNRRPTRTRPEAFPSWQAKARVPIPQAILVRRAGLNPLPGGLALPARRVTDRCGAARDRSPADPHSRSHIRDGGPLSLPPFDGRRKS